MLRTTLLRCSRTLSALVLLILWGVVLVLGLATFVVHQNPAGLARNLATYLSTQLDGTVVTAEKVDLRLFPLPALQVKGLILRTALSSGQVAVFVDNCEVTPTLESLTSGELKLASVRLIRPSVLVTLLPNPSKKPPEQPDQLEQTEQAEHGVTILPLLAGLKLTVEDGTVSLRHQRGTQPLTLAGVNGSLQLLEQASLQGTVAMQGDLLLKGYPTPVRLTLPFVATPPEPSSTALCFDFSGATLHMDKDKATFDGRLRLDRTSENRLLPQLDGVLKVEHLSLPRWFGFARHTPPGVQVALNDLSGMLTFTLSPTALDVSHLAVNVLGVPFTGRGGVENFARPCIELDAHTKEASLNTVFPELLGKTPQAPVFSMPPALDLDGTPPAPDDLGYDIRLRAEQTTFWKWSGSGLTFRVRPTPYSAQSAAAKPGSGAQAGSPRLEAALNTCYGGTIKAQIVVEDDLVLALDVANVDAETPFAKLLESVAKSSTSASTSAGSRLGGTLSGTAQLTGQGTTLLSFLTGLRGTVEARLENGFLTTDKQKAPFKSLRMRFQGEGKTSAGRSTSVPYTGQWFADIETPAYRGTANLNGAVLFSTSNWLPIRIESVPARLSGSGFGFGGTADCTLSFESNAQSLTFAGLQAAFSTTHGTTTPFPSAPKNSLAGTLRVRHLQQAPTWEGTLNLSVPDLRSFLVDQGYGAVVGALPPDTLKSLRVSGDLYLSEQDVRLSKLHGQVDKTSFSGSVSRQAGTLPNWKTNLELGLLDVDSYLPKSEKTTPDNATRWPVEQLHTFEVQGKLHAQELRIAKIPHTNVVLPFTLKSGVFTAEPVAARVCGGEVSAIFRTEATPRGALTRLQYTLAHVDMLALTQARKQDTLLSGSGTLTTDIHALLRSSADIPSALNGTWAFRINDGSLDPQKPLPANARSRFFSLGASGTLTSGVLNSRDLALAGAGLAVHGQGSINLVNWTLDYDILASGTGMPDIPIRYHGSLDDPKRSIDALRVIGNTLGTIGSGILGIIDDVLSAPLKIIGPPRGQHH